MTGFSEMLGVELRNLTETIAKAELAKYSQELDKSKLELNKLVTETRQAIKTGLTVKIQTKNKVNKLSGLKHQSLDKLITLVSQDMPVLLVGMAGTGKTHAGEQTATALGIPFYALSVGAQTSKSDIVGYLSATGDYIATLFRKAYEQGGVFLMDEIDAGNSNVLIQINAALSNNYCAFPDGMIKRHKDFRFIATANTYGLGASRMYVGRNQLDAATLDRFAVLNWDIDTNLEMNFVGDNKLGLAWIKVVRAVRQHVDGQGIRALVTPRATLRGCSLLNVGLDFEEVLKITILNGIPGDQHGRITAIAESSWQLPPKELPVNSKTRNKQLAQAVEIEV